jgi:mRNA interferase RelE/StbE
VPWYRIAYLPEVISDLASIDTATAQRLLDKTKWLASNAGNLRHDPLAAEFPSLSQYAVGDWRIFYSLDQSSQVVDVHLIAHCKTLRPAKRQGS